MSTISDYKLYKQYEPAYKEWKYRRDVLDSKRIEYLKQNLNLIKEEDIQRGKTLLRAIDIMDEHSQKWAEDTEFVTEAVIGYGLEFATFLGMGAGWLAGNTKYVKGLMQKSLNGNKNAKNIFAFLPMLIGGIFASAAVYPLMNWGARAEIASSRKGRFEAMRKELDNPKAFAILSKEQQEIVKNEAKGIVLDDDKKKVTTKFTEGLKYLKNMAINDKAYLKQRKAFENELAAHKAHINDEITEEDSLRAKRDQQLLTKMVEKIDIASQDYAENVELATQSTISILFGLSALFKLGGEKILSMLKVKSAGKISNILAGSGAFASLAVGLISANVQKEASRAGRYIAKKELLENPENFVYVDDKIIDKDINIELKTKKKKNIFAFLVDAYKNDKEYKKYKKTTAKEEKRMYKAIEKLEISNKQLEEAKQLQKNTFRTFNAVDENSQKYSESVEALGQSISYPISLIFSGIGALAGMPYLMKAMKQGEKSNGLVKYAACVILSTLPSIGINAYLTKEQKKASRVADMMAINEMQDYRLFRA